ncbi:MAG: hypothetical protein OEW80_12630, partial [Gemmatimonadota bacterium]|nr:hypothetical protein [Gemmatimonadota bacterium]
PGDEALGRQLLISMIALSWFDVVHGPTVLRGLGVDSTSPAFLEERRSHVVSLVVQGLIGRVAVPSREPTSNQA